MDPSADRRVLTVLRRRTSVEWTGRGLVRLVDTHARVESQRALHWGDWWVVGLPLVAGLDLALYLTLQSRPGALALRLWPWAPPAIVLATTSLLAGALVSALRGRRTWNWTRGAAFLVTCGLVFSSGVYQTYPSSHDDQPSSVAFRLPLGGPVTVAWGGPTHRVNYHVGSPPERWAYDLLVTRAGRTHAGDGTALADYFSYGRDVLAPAAGTVVAARDGEPDAVPGRPDRDGRAGNHVVLEVEPGVYLFIAHLRGGSVLVQPGQTVRQGQVLGQVGNSGNTSEPHVHLHLQDSPTPDRGEGIPMFFSGYRVSGQADVVARGMPMGGQRRGALLGQTIEQTTDRIAKER
jgi:murein DD-endopeptidase MepM/ murein hydrolase activator NlpD